MSRSHLTLFALLLIVAPLRADQFEHYTNPAFDKAASDDKLMKPLTEITSVQLGDHGDVLADTSATFLIVRTNDDRWAKMLVQPARQRFGKDVQAPMLLIEKLVTFKESTERTVKAKGE